MRAYRRWLGLESRPVRVLELETICRQPATPTAANSRSRSSRPTSTTAVRPTATSRHLRRPDPGRCPLDECGYANLDFQAWNLREAPGVSRGNRPGAAHRRRRDQKIVRPDVRSLCGQRRPQACVDACGHLVERQNHQSVQDAFHECFTAGLTTAGDARCTPWSNSEAVMAESAASSPARWASFAGRSKVPRSEAMNTLESIRTPKATSASCLACATARGQWRQVSRHPPGATPPEAAGSHRWCSSRRGCLQPGISGTRPHPLFPR